jgi:transcriptional antiterminator Rof (Rho-off)
MEYQPIECSLHDRFEAAAVMKRPVTIRWNAGQGEVTHSGLIRDVRVTNGAEYLILDGAPPVRLDWIRFFEERSD